MRAVLLFCVGLAAGLRPAVQSVSRTSQLRMVSSAPPATLAKKQIVIDSLKEAMDSSMLMFCVRTGGITVNEMNMMRQKFPEGVTVQCAKNTLVKRATEDFPKFQGGDQLLKTSNYWFFVPETDVRATVETWNGFIKESKKEGAAIVGGVFEGTYLDAEGVDAITKLPTKQELMATTATLLTILPQKLAKSLKGAGAQRIAKGLKEAQGQKLARSVQAASEKLPSA